ncbi:hypothetical protein GQX74_012629 [Glossina fuscipes]|nr:hypothetical protein GQX74_012629 [Glossina fuscipes]
MISRLDRLVAILYSSESWKAVQQGEIPRHLQLFCDRFLCERVVPRNRVLIQGIYSIRQVGKPTRQDGREKSVVGVRAPYMRVVGIAVDTEGSGAISRYSNITSEEEETFRRCTLYSIMPTINILKVQADYLREFLAVFINLSLHHDRKISQWNHSPTVLTMLHIAVTKYLTNQQHYSFEPKTDAAVAVTPSNKWSLDFNSV